MIARNATVEQLRAAAESAGVEILYANPCGSGIRFRLGIKPGSDRRFGRLSPSGRRVAAVCWHGHYRFFRALFAAVPEARVQTAMLRANVTGDRWYTMQTFDRLYLPTGYRNIGSIMQPCQYREACDCVSTGDYIL